MKTRLGQILIVTAVFYWFLIGVAVVLALLVGNLAGVWLILLGIPWSIMLSWVNSLSALNGEPQMSTELGVILLIVSASANALVVNLTGLFLVKAKEEMATGGQYKHD